MRVFVSSLWKVCWSREELTQARAIVSEKGLGIVCIVRVLKRVKVVCWVKAYTVI